jgi:hypothetical protein
MDANWRACRISRFGGLSIGFGIHVALWNPMGSGCRWRVLTRRFKNCTGFFAPGLSIYKEFHADAE